MTDNDLEARLQSLIDRIDGAITKTRQNQLIDISFMDQDVAALCREIIESDREEAKALEPRMIDVINRLDELAEEIKHYQDRTDQGTGQ